MIQATEGVVSGLLVPCWCPTFGHYGPWLPRYRAWPFRRYLGGGLLGRTNPSQSCLQPSLGAGHWEHQGKFECDRCALIEEDVTASFASRVRF